MAAVVRFGSVCSGIEAASVAWEPLGWQAAWFSEIEPFPCAVLAHHYPTVPNYGDMTRLPERIRSGEVEAPDVFCGGTPCQAFSVAGLRKSLDDDRGNLTLTFCEIANAIDDVRRARGQPECIIFWENVPGVLSTKDNAFGCFLGALSGADSAIVSAPGWTDAGVVAGSRRSVAWRTLDAQFFGLAQRRRRVFVVSSARAGFNPDEVLLEWQGLRRDIAPSRETREGIAGGVEIGPSGGRLTDLNPTLDARAKDGPIRNQLAGAVITPAADPAYCLETTCHDYSRADGFNMVAHSLRGEGFDASEDGTGRGTPLVIAAHAFDARQSDVIQYGDKTGPLDTDGHSIAVAQPVAIQGNLIGRDEGGPQGVGASDEGIMYTLTKADVHGVAQPVTYDLFNVTAPVNRQSRKSGDPCHTLAKANAEHAAVVQPQAMQVRRLTPTECERLQGFPDGYTAIPWRGKSADECPDGPRYKALGNSWAVPVVRWIGDRINAVQAMQEAA